MKFLASAVPITESTQVTVHRERWAKVLLELVQALHKEGFVHGDLHHLRGGHHDAHRLRLGG